MFSDILTRPLHTVLTVCVKILTVIFDSMGAFSAGVRCNPVNFHSHKGVQTFATPGDRQVGSTDHLYRHTQK